MTSLRCYWITLLVTAVVCMGGTQVKAQSGSVVRERKMTRVDWSRTFWQEAKIDLKHSGGVAAAFVPRTLSSMTFIVRHGKQSPSGEQEEVWVADAGGVRPKLILREKESRLSHIQWSPSGEYMAYVAKPRQQNSTTADKGLFVVQQRTGRRIHITAENVTRPQWNYDGSSLFFWQKNDAGKWQLLKADLPSGAGQPKVERTATTNFYQVGSVSPDSLRVAGMEEEGQLVVEDLVDHKRVELQREQWGGFPLSSALELLEYEGPGLEEEKLSIKWSPDSQWIYLQMWPRHAMVRPVFAFLLNPSSKTLLNLGQMAPGFGPLREDESGQVLAAGWIPGPRRRMLIWSQKSRHIIKLPDMTLPEGGVATFERKWLILDVDTRTSEIVSGLGPFHPETNYQSPSIIWSLDAQSVIIDGQQYALEPRM